MKVLPRTLPLLLHLVAVVCPGANHCPQMRPDRAVLGRAGGTTSLGDRVSTLGWVANLMLYMKRFKRVSGPVIRFPLPHVCVNSPTAARLASHRWLRLVRRGHDGVGAPRPDALSKQAGGSYRGPVVHPDFLVPMDTIKVPPHPPTYFAESGVRGCC